MKKISVISVLLFLLAMSGCNKSEPAVSSESAIEEAVSVSETSESLSEDVSGNPTSEAEIVSSSEEVSEVSSDTSDEAVDNTGGEDYCYAHKMVYHSFENAMINYVGADNFNAWLDSCTGTCSSNIAAFVEYFDFPEDEFRAIQEEERSGLDDKFWEEIKKIGMTQDEYMGSMMLSDEQIDAIYSGDEAKIETAFSGYLAANASDGSRYSITWLKNHDAEDYAAAGIDADSFNEMINLIETDDEFSSYRSEVSALSDVMTSAEAIMETE